MCGKNRHYANVKGPRDFKGKVTCTRNGEQKTNLDESDGGAIFAGTNTITKNYGKNMFWASSRAHPIPKHTKKRMFGQVV